MPRRRCRRRRYADRDRCFEEYGNRRVHDWNCCGRLPEAYDHDCCRNGRDSHPGPEGCADPSGAQVHRGLDSHAGTHVEPKSAGHTAVIESEDAASPAWHRRPHSHCENVRWRYHGDRDRNSRRRRSRHEGHAPRRGQREVHGPRASAYCGTGHAVSESPRPNPSR